MMDYKELLDCIRKQYADILGDKLVGIYVHGSIAFGCFNPHKSDIDFLVVIKKLTETCSWMNGEDKDLAAHFTVIKNVGYVLCGDAVSDVFGEVPKEAYLDSIKYDVEDAENEVLKDPVYIILNLCRVSAFIQNGLVLSKKQGGIWGTRHLPKKTLVRLSDRCYNTKISGGKVLI